MRCYTSTSGQTKKPVHWPPMATKSMSTLRNLLLSLLCLDASCSTAGMKHRQFVIIAPFTTSNSGRTTKMSKERPTMCIDSKTRTTKKSEKEDRLQDLKRQILKLRMKVPNSGMRKAKKRHQVQATLSVVGNCAWYSRPRSKSWLQYFTDLIEIHPSKCVQIKIWDLTRRRVMNTYLV